MGGSNCPWATVVLNGYVFEQFVAFEHAIYLLLKRESIVRSSYVIKLSYRELIGGFDIGRATCREGMETIVLVISSTNDSKYHQLDRLATNYAYYRQHHYQYQNNCQQHRQQYTS